MENKSITFQGMYSDILEIVGNNSLMTKEKVLQIKYLFSSMLHLNSYVKELEENSEKEDFLVNKTSGILKTSLIPDSRDLFFNLMSKEKGYAAVLFSSGQTTFSPSPHHTLLISIISDGRYHGQKEITVQELCKLLADVPNVERLYSGLPLVEKAPITTFRPKGQMTDSENLT